MVEGGFLGELDEGFCAVFELVYMLKGALFADLGGGDEGEGFG